MASTHTSMRHAILITAYTDFVQLISLVEMFDYRFDIYIHIDKKAKISNTCFHLLEALPNVKVVDRVYAVNRGGRNHIDARLAVIVANASARIAANGLNAIRVEIHS